MKTPKALYHRHRFPDTVINCAVRWYFRSQLSLRDIEELLLERGVVVSYETIRRWCDKFGKQFVQRVRQARPVPGTTWHLDEVFVQIGGEEFFVLLPQTDIEEGSAIAERVRKRTAESAPHGLPGYIVSIGIACLGLESPDTAGLRDAADKALTARKGKERTVLSPRRPRFMSRRSQGSVNAQLVQARSANGKAMKHQSEQAE